MSLHLMTLPIEVQRLVLDCILHPADLKALCLVSKQISELATECLYRNLTLPYKDTDKEWYRLEQLAQSRGLRYVRAIDVGSSSFTNYKFCRPLDEAIAKLPLHKLKSFRYGPLGRPTPDGLRQLWQNQHNLTNLQLDFALYAPSVADVVLEHAAAISSLKCVTKLALNLFDLPDYPYDIYERLIDLLTIPDLRSLNLRNAGHEMEDHFGPVLMSRFWLRLLPASLTSISLSYVYLSTAAMSGVDRCSSLKHLQLNECLQLDPPLDLIRRPSLSSLTVQFDQSNGFKENLAAVIRFLSRFDSLQHLILDANGQIQECDEHEIQDLTASVKNHRRDLHSLFINISPPTSAFDPFARLALDCKELRQLAIRAEGVLGALCHVLASALPHLTTLNVIKLSSPYSDLELESIAKQVFTDILRSARLSILVFGEVYHYGNRLEQYSHKDRKPRCCFYKDRTMSVVMDGTYDAAPVRIKASQAKYVEPESDILDYALIYSS